MLFSLLLLILTQAHILLTTRAHSFFPQTAPLAIRSPYMNVWYTPAPLAVDKQSKLVGTWKGSITDSYLGSNRIKVDGEVYEWLGHDPSFPAPHSVVNMTPIQITPSRTIFIVQAGTKMNLSITFLSPIEPSDWVKQSLPFSYFYLEAVSLDGRPHDVQLYSDITSAWLSDNDQVNITARTTYTDVGMYYEVELLNPRPYQEVDGYAEDGKFYFGMASRPGSSSPPSWQIGNLNDTRNRFYSGTALANTSVDCATTGLVDSAVAIMMDLGTIQNTSSPIIWFVGYVRDPSIKYITPAGTAQQRRPYFFTQYFSIGDAIDAFIGDFDAARNRAIIFDNKLDQDASKVSPEYARLVALAARQTMALDITAGNDSGGNLDPSDMKIFFRDIGGLQSSRRTNPADQMYAAFPAYLYLNASFAGGLLRPLVESQDKPRGRMQPYPVRDMGSQYPTAQAELEQHYQGIEESGNMLIMLYAHARISGDGSLLGRHYEMYTRWADWLVDNSLMPTNQMSADAECSTNMTNLALKGIIGVKAMAEISRAVGHDSHAHHYDGQAARLIGSWQELAMSSDGQSLLGMYGDQNSWSLVYNLYADKLLGTNLVPQAVVEAQTRALKRSMPNIKYGFSTDSGTLSNTINAAWNLFVAATTDEEIRNSIIQQVWARTSMNGTQDAFSNVYHNISGETMGGRASPALGAMFSVLALNVPNTTIVVPFNPPTSVPGSSHARKIRASVIAGAVVGGFAVIALACGTLLYYYKKYAPPSQPERLANYPEPWMFITPFMDGEPKAPLEAGREVTMPEPDMACDIRSSTPNGGRGPVSGMAQASLAGVESGRQLSHGRVCEVLVGTAAAAASLDGAPSGGIEGNLRREMERLRRQVEDIRAGQVVLPTPDGMDLPPEYSSTGTAVQ